MTTINGNLFKTKSRESWGVGRGGWEGRRLGGGEKVEVREERRLRGGGSAQIRH